MPKIIDYPEDAKYSIKFVSQRTGVQPVTLRAWERRYKILEPSRAENGYRLYSERDVALLVWLKNQVDTGISISSAIADFRSNSRKGISPEAIINTPAPTPSKHSALPASEFVKRFYSALIIRDETSAGEIFEEAMASFDLFPLFEMVLIPTLRDIGDAWYNGKIFVAVEHFASGFIRSKLMSIYQSLPMNHLVSYIMVGGAPGELHEIGSLMTAVLLRNAGYRVEYLGPDLPLDDLVQYIKEEKPKMVILSATIQEATEDLVAFDELISDIHPKPIFGYGGAAFNRNPDLVNQTPGSYLGETISQSIKTIQNILDGKKRDPLAG
jgi:MerR family transcriptional regulator, light-induced transcriptional regulator